MGFERGNIAPSWNIVAFNTRKCCLRSGRDSVC
jgi:hypothetical protein